MQAFTTLESRVVSLVLDDIDTDQIIPAQFLKVTDKHGLGERLFFGWRYNSDGSPKHDFVLNQAASAGAEILLAGKNFGCGSSREHAPWALLGCGFRAVLALSFADIFCNNAIKNGLLPVALTESAHTALRDVLGKQPDLAVNIDLQAQHVSWAGTPPQPFVIDAFSKECLLNGVDQLGFLMSYADRITQFEDVREG